MKSFLAALSATAIEASMITASTQYDPFDPFDPNFDPNYDPNFDPSLLGPTSNSHSNSAHHGIGVSPAPSNSSLL